MNTTNSASAPIPPLIPSASSTPGTPPGESPEEREPIVGIAAAVEAILRQPRQVMYHLRQPGSGSLIGAMLLVAAVCSLIYGAVVGTFSMGEQVWASPIKIAVGLMISALICLPSLYIFACLSGARARLAEICGLLAGLLMLMTLLLVGFAPVAWLFSQSTQSAAWMGALHLLFWLVATIFGIRFLQAGFSHSQARSRAGLHTWIVLFVLVMLQMTAALHPLLGKADTFLPREKMFFVTHWVNSFKDAPVQEPR